MSLPCVLLATVSVQLTEFFEVYCEELIGLTELCNIHELVPVLACSSTKDSTLPAGLPATYNEILPFWKALYETSLQDKILSTVEFQVSRFETCHLLRLCPATLNPFLWERLLHDISLHNRE